MSGQQLTAEPLKVSFSDFHAAQPNQIQVQYRMHPLIREWPSSQFYNGRLQDTFVLVDSTAMATVCNSVGCYVRSRHVYM